MIIGVLIPAVAACSCSVGFGVMLSRWSATRENRAAIAAVLLASLALTNLANVARVAGRLPGATGTVVQEKR